MPRKEAQQRIYVEYAINKMPPTKPRPNGTFVVSIWFDGKYINVGSFANIEVARIARNQKMREIGLKAKSTVAGAEFIPDDLKLDPVLSKKAIAKETKSQKTDRLTKAKTEATIKESMVDYSEARLYHPDMRCDTGKDYTPNYRRTYSL